MHTTVIWPIITSYIWNFIRESPMHATALSYIILYIGVLSWKWTPNRYLATPDSIIDTWYVTATFQQVVCMYNLLKSVNDLQTTYLVRLVLQWTIHQTNLIMLKPASLIGTTFPYWCSNCNHIVNCESITLLTCIAAQTYEQSTHKSTIQI